MLGFGLLKFRNDCLQIALVAGLRVRRVPATMVERDDIPLATFST